MANSKTLSSEASFLSTFIIPDWIKLCAAEPCVPRLPPFFWKIVLIFNAVLFLLSVKVSTITAILSGPNPSYLRFSKFAPAAADDLSIAL